MRGYSISTTLFKSVLACVLVVPFSATAAVASEFCEVLNRWNSEKKISDAAIRQRVEGEYGRADDGDRLKTWNIETMCEDFLVAVPLWADVSPPVMVDKGGDVFEDYNGATWAFQVGADGIATSVTMTAADGTVTEMNRLGDPRSFD